MDKSWMYLHRFQPEYTKGVDSFIATASNHTDSRKRIRCPCKKCKNLQYKHIDDVKTDLLDNGMYTSYSRWVHHGEDYEVMSDDEYEEDNDDGVAPDLGNLEIMLEDFRAQMDHHIPNILDDESVPIPRSTTGDGNSKSFDKLLNEARQPLYPGCKKFSTLDYLVKLLHFKTISRLSNKGFNIILSLIKAGLPEGETLPNSYYEAKAMLRNLGLGYIPIHACVNDCVLFWKENEKLDSCPKCHSSRYKCLESKGKKIPQKVLRYFPLAPRLKRLFMSRLTSKDMRWHKQKRVHEENVYRHPADSQAWEEFDKEHEWFASDARNVRLGLATDGFNPFGNMSNVYSMWPVMLIPYNLPPWKCMKDPFIFMSLLIPGPKAPGNDIDVYLRPLVDELKELWEVGIDTYDATTKKPFRMHAALLWTINDFPAYANLSGWSTKGKMACPKCNKETDSLYLKNGRKLCFVNHARFLPPRHVLRRRSKRWFVARKRNSPPKELSGDDLLAQLEKITFQSFGKVPGSQKKKRSKDELNWTKKSIFFELPYWKTLKLPHNLDVMHTEKNICENVLGTLMKLEGKTKDTVKARLDLQVLGIRKELHLKPRGDKFIMPPACYTLSPAERTSFCEWLKEVKFPDGFASNISRCVNVKDRKIMGMKSHDCHVLLERLLPIAIRGYLTSEVCTVLIELGLFFKELCCKTIRLEVLKKMEKDIAVILSKMEQIFPPAFFDVMVHLAIHLPREAILGGPVHYRWMYPIERFLHTLKQYVRNKARPEGSIAEAYVDSECLTFCSMYLQGIETRFNREERNFDGGLNKDGISLPIFAQSVRPLGAYKITTMDLKDYNKAHYFVLNNVDEVAPFIDKHKAELKSRRQSNLQVKHEEQFATWFEQRASLALASILEMRDRKVPGATDELYSLARMPDRRVKQYSGCIVNGIRFHTKDREKRLKTQNSGVMVNGEHQSKDIEFYGVLTDIIELNYIYGNRVFLFRCDWWDVGNTRTGIQTDSNFTSVNTSRTWYKNDPFVLASQASQVFYVSDTKLGAEWQVVQKVIPRNVYDVPEIEKEVEVEQIEEAYQQEEQLVPNNYAENDQIVPGSLNLSREDLEPDEIDASEVIPNLQGEQIDIVHIDVDPYIDIDDDADIDVDDDDDDDDGDVAEDATADDETNEVLDEVSDEEDDTLIEYCSEPDPSFSGDDDTDID